MRLRKITTIALSVAMTFAMAFGMGVNVKADKPTNAADQDNPADVTLTKNLAMDANVATPGKTFTFEFTKVSVDGKTEATDLATMPAIADKNGIITTAKAPSYLTSALTDPKAAADTTHTVKVVEGDTKVGLPDLAWPHAGVYVYTVKEKQPTAPEASYEYSKAEYTVTVYVANKLNAENKEYGDGVYVASVGVEQTKNDAGDTITKNKVDASTTTTGITGEGTEFAFLNRYNKMSDLTISKTVSGSYADKTKDFSYKMTLHNPETGTVAESYTAIVYNGDTPSATTVEFEPEKETSFTLKHGQSLKFVDADGNGILPVGVTYEISESGETDYTPKADVTYNGEKTNLNAGTVGEEYVLDETTVDNTPKRITVIGENANAADFTNTYKTVTPTGILVKNLPYILLVIVAVGGFAMYVASKRRRR